MRDQTFMISPDYLAQSLGSASWPQLFDVRAADVRAVQPDLPAARWIADGSGATIAALADPSRPIVVSCKAGLNRSQGAVAELRALGVSASVLEGGSLAWAAAGHPVIQRSAADHYGGPGGLGHTQTAEDRPRTCPWLVTRFLDADARFLFVDPQHVAEVAGSVGGIAYDTPGVELEHDGPRCTFDVLIERLGLGADASLSALATIVRAADTDDLALSAQAAGYLAISLGLSSLAGDDDHAMLRHGFVVLDGLYAWIRKARTETHSWTSRS